MEFFAFIFLIGMSFLIAVFYQDKSATKVSVFFKAFATEFIFLGTVIYFKPDFIAVIKVWDSQAYAVVLGGSLVMSALIGVKSAFPFVK